MQLIPSNEAADIIGIDPKTLSMWRYKGGGPKYHRFGNHQRGRVYYKLDDINAWLDERRFSNTAEEVAQ